MSDTVYGPGQAVECCQGNNWDGDYEFVTYTVSPIGNIGSYTASTPEILVRITCGPFEGCVVRYAPWSVRPVEINA